MLADGDNGSLIFPVIQLGFAILLVVVGLGLFAVGRRNRDDRIAFTQIHQDHPLRYASGFLDVRHISAYYHAAGGDNHQIVILLRNNAGRSDPAGFFGHARGDNAASAATLAGIVINGSTLAIPVLGDDQEFAILRCEIERDDSIIIVQANTAHAATGARGCAQFLDGETDRLSMGGNE